MDYIKDIILSFYKIKLKNNVFYILPIEIIIIIYKYLNIYDRNILSKTCIFLNEIYIKNIKILNIITLKDIFCELRDKNDKYMINTKEIITKYIIYEINCKYKIHENKHDLFFELIIDFNIYQYIIIINYDNIDNYITYLSLKKPNKKTKYSLFNIKKNGFKYYFEYKNNNENFKITSIDEKININKLLELLYEDINSK